MGQILIFSELDNVGYELLRKGLEIAAATGAEPAVVVLGEDLQNRANEYIKRGAAKVYIPGAGKEVLQGFDSSVYAEAIAQIVKKNQAATVMVGCTRNGKALAGQLAQKIGAGCINDINGIELKDSQLVCQRYALGGATVSKQIVAAPTAVLAIMPATFEQAAEANYAGEVVEVDLDVKPSRVRVLERKSKATDTVDIAEAQTLVCVGMGLGGKENLPPVEELAKALGGEVGCSKPVATDKKWLSEARLVGISGKTCKPQLAICLGVSGQVQFTVGIREAKTIVAINEDQNASIFQISDYGIVGDLNEVTSKLTALLSK